MWIIDQIKAFFNSFLKAFKDLIAAAFPVAKQIIIGQLSNFAEDSIKELSLSTLTNEERRKAAFEKIKGYAIANSIEARDSLINALIELAVLKLKNTGL